MEQGNGFISLSQIRGGGTDKTILSRELQHQLIGDPGFHHDF